MFSLFALGYSLSVDCRSATGNGERDSTRTMATLINIHSPPSLLPYSSPSHRDLSPFSPYPLLSSAYQIRRSPELILITLYVMKKICHFFSSYDPNCNRIELDKNVFFLDIIYSPTFSILVPSFFSLITFWKEVPGANSARVDAACTSKSLPHIYFYRT